MHLLERYSLSCGHSISRPFILDKFFPLAVDKYITLHPFSKYQSKCYDFWQDVVDIILPVLKKNGIEIVQLGVQGDKNLKGCYSTAGQTNINQAAYIISHSLLHVGADSFATHVASGFGKKIVSIYSNNFANCVRPYWGSREDHILLEPDRSKVKPNFSAQEHPKTINEIKPEVIAKAVFQLLGITEEIPFETVFVGEHYFNKLFETVPNQVVDLQSLGVDSIIVRMDFLHDENCLAEQLKRGACCIVTNKPISPSLIRTYRAHIKELVYDIQKQNAPNFIKTLQENAINHFLSTELEGEDLNAIKLDYLDFPLINQKPKVPQAEIARLRSLDKKLLYRSAKITLSDGKMYPSKAAWLGNKPMESAQDNLSPLIDNQEFWQEANSFRIVSTTK
jgi:hypothetical protein